MNVAIYIIFVITYALIASRRLSLLPIGRPAGAMLGAVLMVVFGALSPEESYRAIDHNTILLLFSTMGLTVSLERAGFFVWIPGMIISSCRTPMNFLTATALLSGILSALLVNDTVCLFLTPIVLTVCVRAGLPIGPYLLALATSANIGSAATLVGNPQNMIIGSFSGISFLRFLTLAGPASGIGLILNIILLRFFFRSHLPRSMPDTPVVEDLTDVGHLRINLFITGAVVLGFLAGLHLAYTALTGFMLQILADRRDPREILTRIDWPLLLFFCCLFIVVAGLAKTNMIQDLWRFTSPRLDFTSFSGLFLFTTLITIGSNLISNVPMVLVTGPHLGILGSLEPGWILLAFTTTVAGNFTLLGSVANIIVAERARDHYSLGFWEYFRFGALSTILVLAVGVTTIYLLVV